MSDDSLKTIQNLLSDFTEMSLSNFRDAFLPLVRDKNPTIDRFLVTELKNFRGNRGMRAVIANALSEREDESYLDDFASVIEKETDVSLCKECIQGIVRIGSQEAVQKIEFLARSKPNATISALLKQELDKIRHEEKEPATYYLDHIAKGNQNARNCIHASKVLVKMGNQKVVEEIIANFNKYDDLARTEGGKVIARIGGPQHLEPLLDILDRYLSTYHAVDSFLDVAEKIGQEAKEDRIRLLSEQLVKICTPEQEPLVERFKEAMSVPNINRMSGVREELLEMDQPVGLKYLLDSLVEIMDNKIAHANKYHEEYLRAGRVRLSRLRHLLAEAGYGIGKIGGQYDKDDALRARAVDRLILLVKAKDNDISKQALFGSAFFVKPTDHELLAATLETHQLEGMTRLLRTLERKEADSFTDFFLDVAMNHEILDIQEMAMQALGSTEEVHDKVREMLGSENSETKRTAIRIIGEIRSLAFRDDMLSLLEGQSDIIRIEAINSLGKMGDTTVLNQIQNVMHDAKSLVLIEACLKAAAKIGTDDGIQVLNRYSETTRNKKTAIIAIELLVESYKSWTKPLPESTHETLLKHLNQWFEDKDGGIRMDAYRIGSMVVTTDLELYNTLKTMFKDASSRLRAQANWDKGEMTAVEEAVKTVNRNYFFLKDMLEFQAEVVNRCRNYDNPSSTTRINVFEKLLSLLESNDKFLLSAENEATIETLVMTGLELESSWREQALLFKITSFTESEKLLDELSGRLKDVPKQARGDLMDALARMGLSLSEIADITAIKKVVVLEGSGFYRKRLVKFLSDQGYTVRDCGDVEIGMAMIKNELPDLIITEITFTEPYEGLDFSEKIAQAYGSKIQFIFSTNNRERVVVERAVKLRPLAFLHKPYPSDRLLEAIRSASTQN